MSPYVIPSLVHHFMLKTHSSGLDPRTLGSGSMPDIPRSV
jgi:hypothetical protein